MEHYGVEHIIDMNPNKTVSVVIRKAPNLITFLQRTAQGMTVFELSEVGRAALIDLLVGKPEEAPASEQAFEFREFQVSERPRRGRPPKTEAA